jgi:protein translocase SEC61 complex gamma subunit
MLKLAKKPGRDELWLSVKICFLGIAVIGVVGFIIKFISATLQAWSGV